jgi:hypothetical protein
MAAQAVSPSAPPRQLAAPHSGDRRRAADAVAEKLTFCGQDDTIPEFVIVANKSADRAPQLPGAGGYA